MPYPFRGEIVDLLPESDRPAITPFQRIMQSSAVVHIYERYWRRAGYRLASGRAFEREMETMLRLSGEATGGPILDLACGPGVFTRPLAARTREPVVGLDLSMPMLRRAARLVRSEGLGNVVLMRGSAFRLPFADSVFPLVNCCGALHLFVNPRAALGEIRRILLPTGLLTVQTTIRPERPAFWVRFLERFFRFGFFEPAELNALLRECGFDLVRSERNRISCSLLARRA